MASSRGTDPDAVPVTIGINGAALSLPVAPYVTLLDLLRERLRLTGTKKGCDHGQCGACTRQLPQCNDSDEDEGASCGSPFRRLYDGDNVRFVGVVGTAAAVANAIHHATGRRVRSLPVTVDKLLA